MLAVRPNQFMLDEEGVSVVEYALVAALIAIGSVVAIGAVGSSTSDLYASICKAVTGAVGGGAVC